MAALFEGYTLCALSPTLNLTHSGLHGIEAERDSDHVLVTDSARSVTLYKVSDQKPLCSWTVKQGQSLTCPVVYNAKTKEYVAVSDHKIIRIWKEDDITLEKAFKATLSSDVWRIHSTQGTEPVVLFQKGAVRHLDSLLSAPQQTVENVLSHEEVIRWSTNLITDCQHCVLFTTEQKGDHFLYLQQLNPNSLQKYHLETEGSGLSPMSFSVSLKDRHICLLYLYPNGRVYQSIVPIRAVGVDEVLTLPRSLLLRLPVGDGHLEAASALILDEAHVCVVGVPHPFAGTGKDYLCIWNIHFQTLQAGKEMTGKIYGQLWSFSNKLFIPHGKSVSVIPYECPRSCLASALGKLRQINAAETTAPLTPSWSNFLHGEKIQPSRAADTRKARTTRKSQSTAALTIDQMLELVKTEPAEKVQKEMEAYLTRSETQDLELIVGQLVSALVSRSLADASFYTGGLLSQLVQTRALSHSICPDLVLLALEKKDFFLCQTCLQLFPDIPEAITCICLKTFIGMTDSDAEMINLDPDAVSFMEMLITKNQPHDGLQNGFSPTSVKNDHLDITEEGGKAVKERGPTLLEEPCPVSLNKAVLLNEILQTAYSDYYLLPHLKDLSTQNVIIFLQYLLFLHVKYSKDAFTQRSDLRSPTMSQIIDWMNMIVDAHFTVLVMSPDAKELVIKLQIFVRSQVKLFSELQKIQSSLQEIKKINTNKDIGQYSIEVLELY